MGWLFDPVEEISKPFVTGPNPILVSGVDLTRIDGIEVMVAQTILSEVGLPAERGEKVCSLTWYDDRSQISVARWGRIPAA
jgi:hypothetical protein